MNVKSNKRILFSAQTQHPLLYMSQTLLAALLNFPNITLNGNSLALFYLLFSLC